MASSGSKATFEQYIAYHALLELPVGADEAAVKKAYRKKALELHPDKNRDNPKAEELFDAAKKASEVLLDDALRAEFGRRLEAKKQADARFKELDSARQKLRSDLEEREAASKHKATAVQTKTQAADGIAVEQREQVSCRVTVELTCRRPPTRSPLLQLNRLREESRDRIRLEQLNFARATAAATASAESSKSDDPDLDLASAIRVSWDEATAVRLGDHAAQSSSAKGTTRSSTISANQLRFIFSEYGPVAAVTVRAHSALVCFEESRVASVAVASPPPGFTVLAADKTRGSSGAGATVGVKRSRGDDDDKRKSAAVGEPADSSATGAKSDAAASVAKGTAADFSSHESDTLAKLLQAAAARKQLKQT